MVYRIWLRDDSALDPPEAVFGQGHLLRSWNDSGVGFAVKIEQAAPRVVYGIKSSRNARERHPLQLLNGVTAFPLDLALHPLHKGLSGPIGMNIGNRIQNWFRNIFNWYIFRHHTLAHLNEQLPNKEAGIGYGRNQSKPAQENNLLAGQFQPTLPSADSSFGIGATVVVVTLTTA